MFPGVQIKDWREIVEAMKSRLNPSSIAPLDLRSGWRRLRGTGSDIEAVLKGERFYIWHEHPVHHFKNRLFQADREAVIRFLNTRFSAERMEGVDVTIFSDDCSTILVGNHDGDLFVASEAK